MGNTHSSMGLTFGSVVGGLIAAPFTGGASIAYVAIATTVGTGIGATAFTINALNNRDAPKGKETASFVTGLGCGAIGPLGGMAAGMGAEVSIGIEVAGVGLGLGATNAGDDKFKPYIGNQQEAIKYYTQKEEKKHYEKEIQKEVQKEKNIEILDKLDSYMKEQKNYWNNVTSFIKTKNFNCVYTFNYSKFTKTDDFKKIENHLRLYNDDPQVERVYVIRRKLDDLPVYLGWFAHSGLLLKTTNGRWFICEYGTEANKNQVCLYETINIKKSSCDTFIDKKRKWNKQICGSELKVKASINSIKKTMEDKMCKNDYWMLFWNCHIAQETTRESLGLKVDKKYMDKNFEKEYEYSLRGI